MKRKYIFGFFIFILFLAAFDRGLFYVIRAVEKNHYKQKDLKRIFFQKRDFNKHFLSLPKGTYNTLIMGSSRTHRGIHPHYLYKRLKQKAFKIAKGKIRLKFNYYFYREYKKYAGIPKVVIYGLDYFMFKLKSHRYFMKAVAGEDDSTDKYADGLLLLLSNKETIDSFFNNYLEQLNEKYKKGRVKEKGFNVIDPFTGYRKTEALLLRKTSSFKKFGYNPYPGEEGIYLIKLLKEWEADGVQVVLVFLPDYIGTYESNHQMEDFKKDIRRLTAPYKNVFIYDYNRQDKFSLDKPAYFLDGGYGKTNSHLSRAGARVFHRTFLRDIKKHYRSVKNR